MASKLTVTCFKRRKDKSGDSFIKSYAGGTSEWELLQKDESLRSMGCDFHLIEYDDIRGLMPEYKEKVDRPLYLDVRHLDDYAQSVPYRGQLFATHIAGFVIQFAKKFDVSTQPVPTPTPESSALVVRNADTTVATVPAQSDNFTTSWKLPVTIVSVALFLSLIVGGIVFFDWRRRKGSTLHGLTPFLSEVPNKSPPVDFSKLRLSSKPKAKEEEEGAEL